MKKTKPKNVILFDKSAEIDIRLALNLKPEGSACAYVKENGQTKEIKSLIELLSIKIKN
jgi:hypothetical protein